MCETLRNTLRRGRSFVPRMRFRWRSWIQWRRSSFVRIFMPSALCPLPSALRLRCALLRTGLAGLLLQHLAGVAHALLLVRVRLAQSADVRGDLPDELTIDAGHRDVRLLLDRDVDPLRDVEHDRV